MTPSDKRTLDTDLTFHVFGDHGPTVEGKSQNMIVMSGKIVKESCYIYANIPTSAVQLYVGVLLVLITNASDYCARRAQ